MATFELTDANFEAEVIEKSKSTLVLVDFWAPWCAPCRMIGPVLEELSDEMGNKIRVGKLNVDASNQTAVKYQIMGIPNMKLFKDGKVIEEFVGVQPKSIIQDVLNKHL
ncbi:MAG: thioredoxin [Clostridiales bacterium]|nr:thioredoxin [Clostridiales bacterium]